MTEKRTPFYLEKLQEIITDLEADKDAHLEGLGLYRWIASFQLANYSNSKTAKVRYECDRMHGAGMIDRKKQEGACILYSVKKLEGYEIKGDYFVRLTNQELTA